MAEFYTTPTREQVVQWARAISKFHSVVIERSPSWLEGFATLARADLEATIAEQAKELTDLRLQCITDFGQYQEAHEKIAEQAKEIEDIKGGMAYRNSLVGRLESERDQLRKQIEELAEAIRVKDALLSEIAKQTPEKPNYWASRSQCERNSADAEDVLTIQPSPEILAARDQRVAEACAKLIVSDNGKCDSHVIASQLVCGEWRKYLLPSKNKWTAP